MTVTKYRFYPQGSAAFSAEAQAAALQYPGVRLMKDNSIEAPLNAAWLCESSLQAAGVAYKPWTPKERLVKRWQSIAELIVHAGLRSHDPRTGIAMEDFLLPYQKREPFKYADAEGWIAQWSPGAGKSLGMMLWGLIYDGPIAIVTGAKGRLQWRDAIRRFTTHEPVILSGTGHIGEVELPVYEREVPKGQKAGKAFPAELRASFEQMRVQCFCTAQHRHMLFTRGSRKLFVRVWLPPGHHELSFVVGNMTSLAQSFDIEEPTVSKDTRFIVCGWETLPYHVSKIIEAKPVSVVLDESHRGKNHRRVELVELTDEQRASEPKAKQLDDGRWVKYVDLENVVSATKLLTHKAKRRGLATATPVKDRVRDLWAQLDYAIPWGWGKYWDWATRYAAAAKNVWGGMDDRGASHLDELALRVSYIRSYVSAAESHGALPAKRREIVYLSPDVQQREDEGFADELETAAKQRASAHSIANIRLAAACSRKRKAVAEEIIEAVNGGANVIVFTARRNDVEALKAIVKKQLSKDCWSYFGHGGESQEDRHAAAVEFMQRASHSLFCGTIYAFGEQIDLHNADLMIVAMLPWTIADLIQAEGRAWRLGSMRPCLFKYMIAEGTLDERVAGILLEKLPTIEKMGTEGVEGMRAAFTGNEAELLASLASDILAGGADKIEGVADGD